MVWLRHKSHGTRFRNPLLAGYRGFVPAKDVETRAKYLDWLTTPAAEREITSERQLAKHYGVSRTVLHKWRTDWRFAAQVQDRLSRHLDVAEIPDVMAALLVSAKDPESPRQVSAAKTIIEYVKWNLERSEDLNIDVRNLSDDELRDLMMEALDTIDERERTQPS